MTGELPAGPFSCILADPPWRWESWGKYRGQRRGLAPMGDRSCEKHYDTAETLDIQRMPIAPLADKDCALFMWATWPMLQEALDTIEAWGFEYKTCAFSWAKQSPKGGSWHMGLGYWTRANTEFCLLATRGKPKRLSASVRQLIVSPRREHSRKPDEQYERIEALVGGPYLEMFARNSRPGWESWGNDTERFDLKVDDSDW